MLYDGVSRNFICSGSGLIQSEVSAYYNSITFSGYYINSQQSLTPIPIYNNNYYKERRISRDSQELYIPAYQVLPGDILLDTWPAGNYFRVETSTVVSTTKTIDYFEPVNITRNNVAYTISADNLLINDHIILDQEYDPYLVVTAVDHVEFPALYLGILRSNSGIHTPEDNVLYVARTVYSDNNGGGTGSKYKEVNGTWYITGADVSGTSAEYTTNNSADYIGPYNGSRPHHHLYDCLNWWEHTYIPTDISQNPSAHVDKVNSNYGSYSMVAFSAYFQTSDLHKEKNKNVDTVEGLVSNSNHFTLKSSAGMPDYLGGTILFSASEALDKNKFIGVGFRSVRWDYSSDIAYKLYRFTTDDGYIRSLGNNYYLFNDNKMIQIKGCTSYRDFYTYGYTGPGFVNAGISAGIFIDSNKNKQSCINIKMSDYVKDPYMFTTLSYISPVPENYLISGKPVDWLTFNPFNGPTSAQYHFKVYDDTVNNMSCYAFVPYAPGIPLFTDINMAQVQVKPTVEEMEFGQAMSSVGVIYRPGTLTNLKKVNGSWKYCNNINSFNAHNNCLFNGASALTTIPSSWDGLSNIDYFGNMFEGCVALTAIPESFSGLKNVTYMGYAFKDCSSISSPLVSWGCEHATYIGNMFANCTSLPAIPKDFIGLENVTYANSAFAGCTALKKMPNSWEGLNSCSTTEAMFYNCKSITTIPRRWTGLASTDMDYMFKNCSSLSSIESWTDFPGTTIIEIFINCTSLKKLPDSWEGFSATNCSSAFANCTSLTDIPDSWSSLSKNYTNPNYYAMFEGCTSLTGIPTTREAWAGFGNGNIGRMFANCTSLTMDPKPIMDGLNRPGFGSQMFKGCVNMANTATYITQSAYSSYFI
jgi:hypothetical protein